jgi:hypothetical protein
MGPVRLVLVFFIQKNKKKKKSILTGNDKRIQIHLLMADRITPKTVKIIRADSVTARPVMNQKRTAENPILIKFSGFLEMLHLTRLNPPIENS